MSVLYKGRRSSLADKNGDKLYYIQFVKSGTIEIDELAKKIELKSSLTQGDVLSVIRNLVGEMRDAFKDGKSVKLEGLGSFYLVARSNGNGVATKEEVNAGQITRAQIRFREDSTRVNGQTRTNLSDEMHYVHADTLLAALQKDGVTDGSTDPTGGDTGGDTGDTGGDTGDGGDDGDLLN